MAGLLATAAPAFAQANFDDIRAQWQGTDTQIAASDAQIMQQLKNHRRVQAGYQQHLAQVACD